MGQRWFSDEELRAMSRPTMDRAVGWTGASGCRYQRWRVEPKPPDSLR
jgi:hypothetical protein